MVDYHRWKADLTGALLIGNVYNICYRQNKAHLCPAAPTSMSQLVEREDQTVQENIPPSDMGIILGSLSQGMHQHILSLGYRTPWEMIKGIDKLILKSDRSQDYSNLTYLLSAKMGAKRYRLCCQATAHLQSTGAISQKFQRVFSQKVEEYLHVDWPSPFIRLNCQSTYHGED